MDWGAGAEFGSLVELQARVPAPFRIRQVGGYAIAGVWLIRLQRVRPRAG